MCPPDLALAHPAAGILSEWATFWYPAMMGKGWTKAQMAAAISRGPHESSMTPEVWERFRQVVTEKVVAGQARLVEWDSINHNPPSQLKILSIAAIPHKSKAYCSILDLSFRVHLDEGGSIPSVNNTN